MLRWLCSRQLLRFDEIDGLETVTEDGKNIIENLIVDDNLCILVETLCDSTGTQLAEGTYYVLDATGQELTALNNVPVPPSVLLLGSGLLGLGLLGWRRRNPA